MISQKEMVKRLQDAGYQVKITRFGWITISKDRFDETYKSIRAAYNDKFNQQLRLQGQPGGERP